MQSEALTAAEALSAKDATAPRVSLQSMKDKISREYYINMGRTLRDAGKPSLADDPLDLLTLCVLVLENGFTIIGKSAPASAENFDPEKGKTFAYEDAFRQLWPLEGYALRERLSAP